MSSPPSELDLEAVFGALHISGWFGGIWFARDGFQRPAPDAVNPAAAEGAVRLYVEGRDAALEASDEDIFAFLTHQETTQGPAGDSVGGRGLASLVDSYGYNTGYSLQVNEETVGGQVTRLPRPRSSHARAATPNSSRPMTRPPTPRSSVAPAALPTWPPWMASGRIAMPTWPPSRTAPRSSRRFRTGRKPAAERSGATGWGTSSAVREALWDVDNAFLEVVHAAGLLNMGAQANRDVELARRAALGASGVLKGWLASYGLGLGAPEPRVLPTWNLGTTPVLVLEE